MNLIEQLGGYEAAKGLFNLYEYSISFKYYKVFKGDFESAGYIDVFIPDLQKALIEYRRQHNIYEVGDMIIDDWIGGNVFPYHEGYEDMSDDLKKSILHHATDEEIKAGKRLEVKSEN